MDRRETYRGDDGDLSGSDKEPYQGGMERHFIGGGDWVNLLAGIEGHYLSECIEEHPLLGGYSDTS